MGSFQRQVAFFYVYRQIHAFSSVLLLSSPQSALVELRKFLLCEDMEFLYTTGHNSYPQHKCPLYAFNAMDGHIPNENSIGLSQ